MPDAKDFTTSFLTTSSPQQVYDTINNVRVWWIAEPGISGDTSTVGGEFTYRYGEAHHTKQRVVELVPGTKVAWLVIEADQQKEWLGTSIVFDISRSGDQTPLCFTHVGLVPNLDCYNDCRAGWTYYVQGNLKSLMVKGRA